MNNALSIFKLEGGLRELLKSAILSPLNRFGTWESLGKQPGREPSDDECALHFIESGALERWRKEHNVPLPA